MVTKTKEQPVKTTAQIAEQVERVNSDIASFQARLDAINAEIGSKYGKESDTLILEAAQLPIRIVAAKRYLDELNLQLEDAQRRELLQAFEKASKHQAQLAMQLQEDETEVLMAFQKALLVYLEKYVPDFNSLQVAQSEVSRLQHTCENLGVNSSELMKIEARFPWGYDTLPEAGAAILALARSQIKY
jgi:hypothetical protein